MSYFMFRSALNIRCGFGAIKDIGEPLNQMSISRLLIITDLGVRKAGLYDRVKKIITTKGIDVRVFDQVEPNPKDKTVERAWNEVKDWAPEALVGLGGGSAMDAAKGVAVLATNRGSIVDYDGVGTVKKAPLPIIAIPTTAGTGSEVTPNAAITNTDSSYKMSIRSPLIIPRLSILDPELLATMPFNVAAESGMDAFIHAAEGFLSKNSNTISDAIATESLKLICPYLRPFVANRANSEAAEMMILGSMFAGMVIGNTGTGNDHALARAVGGFFDSGHGLTCAILFPHVVRFNFIANPLKYRILAKLMGLNCEKTSDSEVQEILVDELFKWIKVLRMPTKLRELNINENSFDQIAEVASTNTGPNPRVTTKADLFGILKEAY